MASGHYSRCCVALHNDGSRISKIGHSLGTSFAQAAPLELTALLRMAGERPTVTPDAKHLCKRPFCFNAAPRTMQLLGDRAVSSDVFHVLRSASSVAEICAGGPVSVDEGSKSWALFLHAFGFLSQRQRRDLRDCVIENCLPHLMNDRITRVSSKACPSRDAHFALLVIAEDDVVKEIYLTRLLNGELVVALDELRVAHRPEPGLKQLTPLKPEMALLMLNLGQVDGYSLVLDPFAGSCSSFLPGSLCGFPMCLGMDVNLSSLAGAKCAKRCSRGQAMADVAGECDMNGIRLSLVGANIFASPLRRGGDGLFDCIICDPPYGLREKRRDGSGGIDDPVASSKDLLAAVRSVLEPALQLAVTSLSNGGHIVFLFPSFVGLDVFTALQLNDWEPSLHLEACFSQQFKTFRRFCVYLRKCGPASGLGTLCG